MGALGAGAAAARQQCAHLGAAFMQALADPGPHAALRDDRNDDAHDRPHSRMRLRAAYGAPGLPATAARPILCASTASIYRHGERAQDKRAMSSQTRPRRL